MRSSSRLQFLLLRWGCRRAPIEPLGENARKPTRGGDRAWGHASTTAADQPIQFVVRRGLTLRRGSLETERNDTERKIPERPTAARSKLDHREIVSPASAPVVRTGVSCSRPMPPLLAALALSFGFCRMKERSAPHGHGFPAEALRTFRQRSSFAGFLSTRFLTACAHH